MCNDTLKEIYRAVVLAKLLYASPAWFATNSDKQRIEAFVRRGLRLGLYGDSDPTPTQLAENTGETLFERIRYNKYHVLQQIIPDHNGHSYCLRPRRHKSILPTKLTKVTS